MKYKWLGKTGVKVSQLCCGTMSFGGDADAAESAKMYGACRDAGINFFDCANGYTKGKALPFVYPFAQSKKLIPASRQAPYIFADSAASASPPNDIVPQQSCETFTPVLPSHLYFMIATFFCWMVVWC